MFRLCSILLLLIIAIPSMAQVEDGATQPVTHYTPPIVSTLPASVDIQFRRDYRQVIGSVDIHDAPNGAVIRTRPAGTFFVTVSTTQGEWAEINSGEWILASQLLPAPSSNLGGIFLESQDTTQTIGLLHESVYLRDTPQSADYIPDTLIEEYNAVYIYEEVSADNVAWVRIGENAWIRRSSVRFIKPMLRPEEILSQRWVGVDISEQVVIAYDNNTPIFATLVSTGLENSPTELGFFSTYARFSPRDMSRGDINQPWFYHMEDVPYTFYFNGNQALHGAYWHDEFGTQQSHGCVNMSLTASYWVYNFLSETLDITDEDAIWSMVWVY